MGANLVPFNVATYSESDRANLIDAVSGSHTAGNGPFTKAVELMLTHQMDVGSVLLTTSCTHALEMAALLHRFQPGDEVIVPSYTFVSSVSALRAGLHNERVSYGEYARERVRLTNEATATFMELDNQLTLRSQEAYFRAQQIANQRYQNYLLFQQQLRRDERPAGGTITCSKIGNSTFCNY